MKEFLYVLAIIFGVYLLSFLMINIRHLIMGREFRGTCSTNNPFLKDKTDKLGLEVVLKMHEVYESENLNKIVQEQVDWVLKHFGIELKKID